MNWTTEIPTTEGRYWVFDGKDVFDILLYLENGKLCASFGGDDSSPVRRFANEFKVTHWYGPLTPPEPPRA